MKNAARIKTANTIGANISPYYNALPDALKSNIQQVPEIGNILAKATPISTLTQAQQIIKRRQNGQ